MFRFAVFCIVGYFVVSWTFIAAHGAEVQSQTPRRETPVVLSEIVLPPRARELLESAVVTAQGLISELVDKTPLADVPVLAALTPDAVDTVETEPVPDIDLSKYDPPAFELGSVSAMRVNLRAGPSGNEEVLALVSEGQFVRLRARCGMWSNIVLPDGRSGWMATRFISDQSDKAVS